MEAYRNIESLVCEKKLEGKVGVSRTTLYRHRKAGLPHHRIGRRVLYKVDEVIDWMRGNALVCQS